MFASRDQLWQGICWPGCALAPLAGHILRLYVAGGKMHFLWEQFQHEKMLPQRDFAAGGFSLASVWKAATPGTTSEAQVLGNCWRIPAWPRQPGSSSRDFLSLVPLWKVLPTHNPSLCFPQPLDTPGNLSSPSPAEKVVQPL